MIFVCEEGIELVIVVFILGIKVVSVVILVLVLVVDRVENSCEFCCKLLLFWLFVCIWFFLYFLILIIFVEVIGLGDLMLLVDLDVFGMILGVLIEDLGLGKVSFLVVWCCIGVYVVRFFCCWGMGLFFIFVVIFW